MKASMTIAGILLFSVSAFAGETPTKQALQVDFNRMIEDNNTSRNEMRKDINAKADKAVEAHAKADTQADKKKVINFVDVEVGWGEAPPIVDRRYDSVGEARVYNMNEDDLKNRENQGF